MREKPSEGGIEVKRTEEAAANLLIAMEEAIFGDISCSDRQTTRAGERAALQRWFLSRGCKPGVGGGRSMISAFACLPQMPVSVHLLLLQSPRRKLGSSVELANQRLIITTIKGPTPLRSATEYYTYMSWPDHFTFGASSD